MINILAGHNLELEIDPNENGLPVLFIHHRYGGRIISSSLLKKSNVEELIKELQNKLKEM